MDKKSFSLICAVITSILWGSAFIAQDMGMDFIGPHTFNVGRFLIGFLTLLPFFFIFEFKNINFKKLDKKEFFGGSMTISSLGGIGGTHFTPIINPPEVAILGVGKTFDRLVREKNQIVSKKILPVSLSYDHRLIDGAEGARFCVYLGKCLGKDFAFKLAV